MKLGCSTLLYGRLPLATALGGIRHAGFQAVELCAIPGMAPHVHPGMTGDERQEVRDLLAAYGLAVESLGASGNLDLGDPDRFREVLRLGSDLGAPVVTVGAGGKFGDDDSYRRFVQVTRDVLIPMAQEMGVVISFKPHVGNSVCNRGTIQRFVNEVDTTWVGLNIDPSHLWRTDPELAPEETIALVGAHVKTGRIRDTREHDQPVGPPSKQVPGGGLMNLPALVRAYREHTSLEYLVVEIVGSHAWADAFQIQRVAEACSYVLQPLLEE